MNILINPLHFYFMKMHLIRSSATRWLFCSELKMLKFYAALGANLCRPILVSIIPRGLQSDGCPVTKILGDQGLYPLSGKSLTAKSRDVLMGRLYGRITLQFYRRLGNTAAERLDILNPLSRGFVISLSSGNTSYCIKWIEALRGSTGH